MGVRQCPVLTHDLGALRLCDQNVDGKIRERDGDFVTDHSGRELRPGSAAVRRELRRLGIDQPLKRIPNIFEYTHATGTYTPPENPPRTQDTNLAAGLED